MHGIIPHLFEFWANPFIHLLLLKSSMVGKIACIFTVWICSWSATYVPSVIAKKFHSIASSHSIQNIVRVCKNLRRLVLDCDFYGRAIRYIISSLSGSLEVLWLQGRNYNDSMCQELSKCSRLRELGLIHVENITPFGLKFLGSLAKLEKLLLFYANNIDPNVFRYLVSSVTRFGEISPLWQNLKPTLANILETEEILITLNGQMLKNNLAIWSQCLVSALI